MSYTLIDTVLIEMITSKDINVSILYNGSEYIVLDSQGLYNAKGFINIIEAKEYISSAYNLKA